jgi:hypothetical protein
MSALRAPRAPSQRLVRLGTVEFQTTTHCFGVGIGSDWCALPGIICRVNPGTEATEATPLAG